jgi:phenylalanyl-tRNA synthetase beta chain
MNNLLQVSTVNSKYEEVPKYPSTNIDLCFEVDINTKYEDLENEIQKEINKDELCGEVECIDIYRAQEDTEKKKITYRLHIKHYNKTLEVADINEIIENIKRYASEQFNARLI